MPDVKHAGFSLSPTAVETLAGLSGGTVATLTVHPLDIAKTRMQIHRSSAPSSAPLETYALLRGLAQTPRPLAALYRGLTPNLIGNASSWASFFFFKSRVERVLSGAKASRRAHASSSPQSTAALASGAASTQSELTPADYFLASALAGAATQLITNPVWVLKTRMLSSDAGAAGAYPSMWAGARALLRDEGPRGFYRGLGVGLLGVSHGAVQFAVYEPAKRLYFQWRRRRRERQRENQAMGEGEGLLMEAADDGREQQRMSNEATLALSTVSKLVAGATTYPLQVLRSRLQNYDADARFGRGIGGVAALLWREEGWRGFYRGLVPGVIRVLPATWVTFLVYENVKYYLPRALA